jgi:hypothetical protein
VCACRAARRGVVRTGRRLGAGRTPRAVAYEVVASPPLPPARSGDVGASAVLPVPPSKPGHVKAEPGHRLGRPAGQRVQRHGQGAGCVLRWPGARVFRRVAGGSGYLDRSGDAGAPRQRRRLRLRRRSHGRPRELAAAAAECEVSAERARPYRAGARASCAGGSTARSASISGGSAIPSKVPASSPTKTAARPPTRIR